MQYYAKTNTADPRTGFITVGEVLTEKQAAALGEEKLKALVKENVLGVLEDGGADASLRARITDEAADGAEATGADASLRAGVKDDAENADEDEELPELGLTEDMVSDGAEVVSTPAKAGGRRKTK